MVMVMMFKLAIGCHFISLHLDLIRENCRSILSTDGRTLHADNLIIWEQKPLKIEGSILFLKELYRLSLHLVRLFGADSPKF